MKGMGVDEVDWKGGIMEDAESRMGEEVKKGGRVGVMVVPTKRKSGAKMMGGHHVN